MLVGEFMVAASAQQQLIEARLENFNININSGNIKEAVVFIRIMAKAVKPKEWK